MILKILCTPTFSKREIAEIDEIAARTHSTREEVVRKAVRLFAAQCVPTQKKAKTDV